MASVGASNKKNASTSRRTNLFSFSTGVLLAATMLVMLLQRRCEHLESDLDSLFARVLAGEIDPQPRSGRQEMLENHVNRFV